MTTQGFLGVDAGTQGLSIVFTDQNLNILGTGESGYQMIAGLDEGCYEQSPHDWLTALVDAMCALRKSLSDSSCDFEVLAIGISGQMHGEVLVDAHDQIIKPARLWCDSRNESEAIELTRVLNIKVPKRMTAARWLWTMRQHPDLAGRVAHITTPAGWIGHQLTGKWALGIGDASGMFPIDQESLDYDRQRLLVFDQFADCESSVPFRDLLPQIRLAGEDAGTLNPRFAELTGLPCGIPVAAAEGDQTAALAGSLIADAGMVAVSFGTSLCANSVGDRAFVGVSDAIDHFCAADGKPINMVFLRNGTTSMNTVVAMFQKHVRHVDQASSITQLMQQVVSSPLDCGGILAIPFEDDEPGMGIRTGGRASLHGLNSTNATPGNVIKAVLLSTIFNLKSGTDLLAAQGFPQTEIILTGGLTQTPALAQILADVTQTTVRLPAGADEGTAIGSALLAKYRYSVLHGFEGSWSAFVSLHVRQDSITFTPDSEIAVQYESIYDRYVQLLAKIC